MNWERKERAVDGVVESALTPDGEIRHREHLERFRQERIQKYWQEMASLAASQVVENPAEEDYRVAAD